MPARRPTALKLLDGTVKRPPPDEPPREYALPAAPKHLSKDERKAWDVFAEKIAVMRITTEEDFAALEMLAVKWAMFQKLTAKLRGLDDPVTYRTVTANGSEIIRPRPEVHILGVLEHKLLELLGRFGLTPADRQRVRTIKGKKGGLGGGGDSKKPEDEFT